MKAFLKGLFISVFFVSLFFIFQSCGNENTITQPESKSVSNKNLTKAKMTKITTGQISSADTVVTLPKSGKTLEVPKTMTKKQLKQLDKYLSKHKNLPTQSISPNALPCGEYIGYVWEYENQYKPVSGKDMGIWANPNVVSPQKLHNQYGFTYYLSSLNGGNDTSITHYFQKQNLMASLSNGTTQDEINKAPLYNLYYIDEPTSSFTNPMSNTEFLNIASWVNTKSSNSILVFSDWFWPEFVNCNLGYQNDGNTIKTYWFPNPNVRIMCDQYKENCAGNAVIYWNEYKSFYGVPNRNISNWISLNSSAYWGILLTQASSFGMNPIWIYGDDSNVNESYFVSFSEMAWQTGWLLRQAKQVCIIWKCLEANPCNYVYPNGTWTVSESYYTGTQKYIQ